MIIAGINAFHADASAAIYVDGKLVAASEEERFSRIKHQAGFPHEALRFCLAEAGVRFRDVNHYVIGRAPDAKLFKKLLYLAGDPVRGFGTALARFKNRNKVSSIEKELAETSGLFSFDFRPKVKNVEHHRSHIASAYYPSPFDEAACISIDGSGDFTTTMFAQGAGNKIEVLDTVDFPHSIGIFYTAFTQLLGFPYYGDEYKVMGMAPYGEPIYVDQLFKLVKLIPGGGFKLDLSFFRRGTAGIISYDELFRPVVKPLYSEKLTREFGKPRLNDEPLTQYHKDLAASVQRVTELVIFHLLESLHKHTGLTDLCIAGGVAQNSVANGKITSNSAFKNVFIPPAGHDAGISMGAALYYMHHELGHPRIEKGVSPYLGKSTSNEEIESLLKDKNISHIKYDDEALVAKVARAIADGKVVGWMQGRAEFGPRALGGRSILADPRRKDAKDLINLKIKRRESFRPFAPSVLKEARNEYFEGEESSPYMERVFPVRIEKRELIPAVTHVDGSGRVQTVDDALSPKYYALIRKFGEITGVPILLNTSFNENEPIVNSPEEALLCFKRTEMDMLVMENFVVER